MRVAHHEVAGRPVYALEPVGQGESSSDVLFLHGGAHAAEILPAHWRYAAKLAVASQRAVSVAIYPLTPEHTVDEVTTWIEAAHQHLRDLGADRVALIGDSAGAGKALVLAQHLAKSRQPMGPLVLLSPSIDGRYNNTTAEAARRDPILNLAHLRTLSQWYAGDHPLEDPRVSPVLGPMADLPPTAIFTGTRDSLNADAHTLHDRMAEADVNVEMYDYPEMLHDWMLQPVPESSRQLDEVTRFLSRHS